jgi:hypothetical protein
VSFGRVKRERRKRAARSAPRVRRVVAKGLERRKFTGT